MATNQDDESRDQEKAHIFYANSIAVTASGYDLSLVFARELPADGPPIRVAATMIQISPVLAKRFSSILATVIERYEEEFGKIPSPPDKTDKEGNQNGNKNSD